MEKNGTIQSLNERLARKVRREGHNDPKSPYANRFVGIANGKVVVVADSLDEMAKQLRKTSGIMRQFKRFGVRCLYNVPVDTELATAAEFAACKTMKG